MRLKALVGAGDRIGLLTLPFLAAGLTLNIMRPELFAVGGPPPALEMAAAIVLAFGVVSWAWSVVLILTRVPRGELITGGPFTIVKHPLYTSVGLLVLPSLGILLNTWLGVLIGVVIYTGSRLFSPAEERALSATFGPVWDSYCEHVLIPWA